MLTTLARRLATETGGAIAIMFALMAPVLIACIGLGVDFLLVNLERQRLQAALDAAALSAAASEEKEIGALEDIIEAYVKANTGRDVTDMVTVTPVGQELVFRLELEGAVQPVFLKILGVEFDDAIDITVDTGIFVPDIEAIEVVLATDRSGSMRADLGALKQSLVTFIDEMEVLDANPNLSVKVGLVPWGHVVQLDPWCYGEDLDGQFYDTPFVDPDLRKLDYPFRRTHAGDTAVFSKLYDDLLEYTIERCLSRQRAYHAFDGGACNKSTDYACQSDERILQTAINWAKDILPKEVENWTLEERMERCYVWYNVTNIPWCIPHYNSKLIKEHRPQCFFGNPSIDNIESIEENIRDNTYTLTLVEPYVSIFPLSQDYDRLIKHVRTYFVSNATNAGRGILTSYMLFSPEYPFREGAAFNDPGTKKVLVFMTDGETSGIQYAKDACDALKDRGVQIYAVGFRDGAESEVVEHCASDPSMVYLPEDQDELLEAFEAIGGQIGRLRLAR
jgi:hypothetical protein